MKAAVFQAVIAKLEAELATLRLASEAAYEAATGEESRPENQYDTRALEASYLASGQGKRVLDTERMIGVLKTFPTAGLSAVGSGALVEAESEERPFWFILLPFGAGISVEVGGRKVSVVTLDSPLGQAMAGKKPGESFELARPGGAKDYEIRQVL